MAISLVFKTHSWSEENDRGVASGWHHSRLSARGRTLAHELGERRRHDDLAVVFVSDLRRAVETADIAMSGSGLTVVHDWRLRECNYGELNGQPAQTVLQNRRRYQDVPYPNGESWRQAVNRVGRFLKDLRVGWSDQRVLVIGHVATRWAFDHLIDGVPLEDLIAQDFRWREGWVYHLSGGEQATTEASRCGQTGRTR
ncbi:histidine phosphatase family protein [Deinococcus sonorensis]|uniref:phosphoglycerate mutase (2,3-diphosphoglycerate-dependent) n=1 Tax=Deinococcus sonorensis TaxID=309891 RepID=A0ABV8YEW7_9DEIO